MDIVRILVEADLLLLSVVLVKVLFVLNGIRRRQFIDKRS